jgi:hypothetical protein
MDTRFWGPSGWRLLHLIAFSYEPGKQKESVRELFTMLPYVLPCKFCRASLADYMEEDPLEPALKSRDALSKWLWRIHNQVNEKLRSQGLLKVVDPSFSAVKKVYEDRIAAGCTRTEFEGWDFLFSIAENHPRAASVKNSLPMPSLPSAIINSPEFRNRWNLMEAQERMGFYLRFWKSIGSSLPFQSWRDSWNMCSLDFAKAESRLPWIRELWRIRCCLEKELEFVNRDEFQSLCKRLVNHRSGCGKRKRAKTCRRITRKL